MFYLRPLFKTSSCKSGASTVEDTGDPCRVILLCCALQYLSRQSDRGISTIDSSGSGFRECRRVKPFAQTVAISSAHDPAGLDLARTPIRIHTKTVCMISKDPMPNRGMTRAFSRDEECTEHRSCWTAYMFPYFQVSLWPVLLSFSVIFFP
jgi:hypothetical protein